MSGANGNTRGMLPRYILKRIGYGVVLIFVVMTLNYVIIHLAPGDPVKLMLQEYTATPQEIQQWRAYFGLDRPLYEQYFIYISNILRGDFGISLKFFRPVFDVIMDRLGATLLLTGAAFIFATLLGITLGVLSARKPYSLTDNLSTLFSLVGYSLPHFFSAMLLILFFSVWLGWFPVGGMSSLRGDLTGIAGIWDLLRHLALPALNFGTWSLAAYFRLTRASMLEVLRKDFITTAKAKGLRERTVLFKHALRNAMRPIVTHMGVELGVLFAGAVMTETVFGWPGMGRLTYEAILYRDYPLLMGIFFFASVMVILGSLIADIVNALLDPRVRYD